MASVLSSSRPASSNEDRRKSKDLAHRPLSLERSLSSSAFPSPASSFIPTPMASSHDYPANANKQTLTPQSSNAKSTYTSSSSSSKRHTMSGDPMSSYGASANGHSSVNGRSVSPTSSGTQVPQAQTQAPALSMSQNVNRYSMPLTQSTSSSTKQSVPPVVTSNSQIASPTISTSMAVSPPHISSYAQTITSPSQSWSSSALSTPTNRSADSSFVSTPHSSSFTTPSDSSPTVTDDAPSSARTPSRHASLTSSRPAPASPTVSRRASRHSGSHSAAPSRRSSQRYASQSLSSSQVITPQSKSHLVIVRDFAYAADDPRHVGNGPDAPRLSRTSSVGDPYESYGSSNSSSKRRSSGWGAFKWGGSIFGGLSTGSGNSSGSKFWSFGRGKDREQIETPSKSDFARNFDFSNSQDDDANGEDDVDEDVEEEDDDEDSASEPYPDPTVPLAPGLYRALYAFEPEGSSEMRLFEGQIVRVIGRGGGLGWAVVLRDDGSVVQSVEDGGDEEEVSRRKLDHALVPESYLELAKADPGMETKDGQ